MKTPKNGLYLTSADNEEFTEHFGRLYTGSGKCSSCPMGCTTNSLITRSITFVVTEDCNLNCSYCYEKHKTSNRMSIDTGRDAVDMLFDKEMLNNYFDLDQMQAVILDFIGGEPLLEIDLIDEITEYFKFKAFEIGHPWAYNYMISISTNGILFDDERVQNFIKKNPGRVSITISIDGNKELHDACRVFPDGRGSYDIVSKAMDKLVEITETPQTKMTLAPENISYMFEAMKNHYDRGLKHVHANCVYENVWKPEDAQILYDQLILIADWILDNDLHTEFYTSIFDENIGQPLADDQDKNYCGGNGEMLAIGTDGRCFPCLRFMQFTLNKQDEQCIGDIYYGIEDKDKSEFLQKLVKITMSSQSTEECNTCQIAGGCALCTAYNYDEFGDANHRATFICDTHKARVCANHYFWNRLYKKVDLDKEFKLNMENIFESR